jgi:Arc/MetJ-type ribon-helix-helix transcriptional regulator
MTVKLSERAEKLVRQQVEAGRYSSPDEAVNRIMEDCFEEADLVDPAIEAALLEALDSPRHVFVEGELVERAKRRAERKPDGVE